MCGWLDKLIFILHISKPVIPITWNEDGGDIVLFSKRIITFIIRNILEARFIFEITQFMFLLQYIPTSYHNSRLFVYILKNSFEHLCGKSFNKTEKSILCKVREMKIDFVTIQNGLKLSKSQSDIILSRINYDNFFKSQAKICIITITNIETKKRLWYLTIA